MPLRPLVSRHIGGSFRTSINATIERNKNTSLGITDSQAQLAEEGELGGRAEERRAPEFHSRFSCLRCLQGVISPHKDTEALRTIGPDAGAGGKKLAAREKIVSGKALGLKRNGKSEAE